MSLTTKQKHDLKKFVKELEQYRGSHTELVSVYVPAGYEMNKIINHLNQEQGTAGNIKSSSTRKNVVDALEKMIQHLKIYKKTPEHGLAVFSGNIASQEGRSDVRVWSIEPPILLKTRTYRCDKEFVLDLLRDMMEVKEVYGLIVVDRRDANIALLKGKTIVPLTKTHSHVPGKQRAGGQCIVKDSSVQLHDGLIPKIEKLHNPHIVKSISINKDLSIVDSNITDKWNVKKDRVYKITTRNPRLELESSKEHVFFVATSKGIIEKRAVELKEGDYAIMPEMIDVRGEVQKIDSKKYYNSFGITEQGQKLLKQKRLENGLLQRELASKTRLTQTTISSYEKGKIHINSSILKRVCAELDINFEKFLEKYTSPYLYRNINLPNRLNEELAQFVGYCLGDGSIEKDRITFFEQNKQVALYYQKKFDRFFKIKSRHRFRESKNYHQIRFTSRPLVRLIKNEFPEIKKSSDSEIPEKVLKSEDKIVAAFLRGLFDAEGYVHVKRGIGFGINNKRLAQQIQLILLRFSILSSLHEYDNRANKYSNNPRFTIDITEKKSLRLFKVYIGFSFNEKNKRLEILINKKSNRGYNRQIIFPGTKIRNIIEQAGYNLQLFPKVSDFFRDNRLMSKEVFKESILSNIKNKKLYDKLKRIYDFPILPVKINKIEKINRSAEMIDISVKNRNFIANGIIVHNSAPRFARIREGAIKDHYKKVAEHVKKDFLENKNLKGIIVGGPGPSKYDFVEGEFVTNELKKKIIAIKDLSYTGEFGLQELVDKSQDVLAKEEIADEKKVMAKFFEMLAKTPDKTSYGEKEVMKSLEMGVVDTLLLSEELEDSRIEKFEKVAEKFKTIVKIISTETREGVQLKELGKVAAILRYEVQG